MSKELVFNENFEIVNNDELLKIANRLSANMNNKHFFNIEPYKAHKSVKIFEDFSGRNLRQSYFQSCTFNGANLAKSGLAGSIFLDCVFQPCDYKDTNFQSCDFRNCFFNEVVFEYTRMNKSSFYKVVFNGCQFVSASVNDAIFDNCQFINCHWTISIENAIFKNTLLDNVHFKSMNFEFATFENIKTNNIKLPFPTIPFIYNGLSYLVTTNDNVRITSAKRKEGLSKEEYLSYLVDLEKFYIATQNFFPLTNIYIATEKYDRAFEAVICGIRIAIQTRGFRMIKYYCKQVKYIKNITSHQRQALYYFILDKIAKSDLQRFEMAALNIYLPEVKDLLYTESHRERIQILIDTNINQFEYEKISTLMSIFDKFLSDKGTYSVELRHDSPFQGIYDILTDANKVGIIIAGISLITDLTFNSINLIHNRKKTLNSDVVTNCNKCKQELASNNIVIKNIYVINKGNVYINNNQNSFNGDIYLNK